jgi:tetratricopeptide (TPR) repeat protein
VAFLSYIQEARDLFYKQHMPGHAEAVLRHYLKKPREKGEKRAVFELMGLILRAQKRYEDARVVYEKINDHYQAGYCSLLRGDLQRVQKCWTQVITHQPNHWCLTLYGMVVRQLQVCPSLLQIRHYLESDICNLITAERFDYLENVLAHVEFLSQLNLEAPKFAGRALFNAGENWWGQAGPYLMQGQKLLPHDPEVYYHMGQLCIMQGHFKEASLMLKQCLLISTTYQPASELLREIPKEQL